MGWKPGKFLKKIGKGLKKAVKSIGKGIKKVVGKIGAAIGKLGVIGQIGMMFLMPYAMSGLSSFFGSVGTKIATWSTKLMGPGAGAVSKGFGKFLGAIHKAGSMAVNAYNTVTTAIGNGVDRVGNFFKGEGFTLSADRASVFGTSASSPVTGTPTVTADSVELPTGTTRPTGTPTVTSSGSEIASTTTMPPSGIDSTLTGDVAQFETNLYQKPNVPDLLGVTPPKAPVYNAASQTVGEYLADLPGKVVGGVKDAFADPGQLAQDAVESGIQSGVGSGIANRVASSIMGDPPVQKVQQITDGLQLAGVLQNDPSGMYNTVNTQLTQQGSPWGAGNLAHFNYMQEGLSDGSDEYARLMQRIS